MKNDRQRKILIDLGAASRETKGGPIGMDDSQAGRYQWPGLDDE